MGLFNFDTNKILGGVFGAVSNVFGAASRALSSTARQAAKVSRSAQSFGKGPQTSTPSPAQTATAKPTAPIAPAQVSEGEPAIGAAMVPGSDKPTAPIAPEPLAPDAGTIAQLMAEIEKLKKERDFLLQAQQAKDSKPFGAADISSNASTFEKQMDIKAAIDAKRASDAKGDAKELRQQAIDNYYYPEDESYGTPDDSEELAELKPGPIPF